MEFLTRKVPAVQDAVKSKTFSKIGDAIVNLVYSLVRARLQVDHDGSVEFTGSPKVPALILKDALNHALSSLENGEDRAIKVKGDAHAIADSAEAIIAHAWARGAIDIPLAVETVFLAIKESGFKPGDKTRLERLAFTKGFSRLLRRALTDR